MGEQYDPSYNFTVNELIELRLGSHRQFVDTVHAAAVAEHAIEVKLEKIQHLWDEKVFKLAKHIPDSMYKNGLC
jgi:hypothetical protein